MAFDVTICSDVWRGHYLFRTNVQGQDKTGQVTAKKMMMFAWQIADGMNFLAENRVRRVKQNYIGQNERKSYLNFIARLQESE